MAAPTAKNVEAALKKLGNNDKGSNSALFFKTGEGEYSDGDLFLGVTVPEQRKVSKEFKDLPLPEIKILLASPFHECRATALFILCLQYASADEKTQKKIAKFYIANLARVNNWDLVDSSARNLLGEYLLDQDRSLLYTLAKSKNMWKRRVAIVATHAYITRGEFTDAFAISEILLDDDEDLLHKAVGWMLREVGKRDRSTLVKFLDKNATRMPRTALRYSIEHFPEEQRQKYLKLK